MDECNIDEIEIRRRPSRRQPNQSLFARMSSTTMSDKKSTRCSPLRTHSLNVRAANEPKPIDRLPVTRNISSPSTMQHPIAGGNQRYCIAMSFFLPFFPFEYGVVYDLSSIARTRKI